MTTWQARKAGTLAEAIRRSAQTKTLEVLDVMDRSEYLDDNFENMKEAIETKAAEIAYSEARQYMEDHDPNCSWKEAFAKTGNRKYFNRYFN